MNTLIFFASPNRNGSTYKLLESFIKGLDGNVDIINVYDYNVKPCIDCGFCSEVEGKCSIEDRMIEIYNKIDTSDNIVIASPMYFGMFPAPMKSIIDRTQMNWNRKYLFKKGSDKKKKGVLIVTAGAEWENMFVYMEKVCKYFFNTIDCKLTYKIYASSVDKIKIEDNHTIINNAYEIGRYIVKSSK